MAKDKKTKGLFISMIVFAVLTLLFAVIPVVVFSVVIFKTTSGGETLASGFYENLFNALTFKDFATNYSNIIALYIQILAGVVLALAMIIYGVKKKAYSGIILGVESLFVAFCTIFVTFASIAIMTNDTIVNSLIEENAAAGLIASIFVVILQTALPIVFCVVLVPGVWAFEIVTAGLFFGHAKRIVHVVDSNDIEKQILKEEDAEEKANSRRELKRIAKEEKLIQKAKEQEEKLAAKKEAEEAKALKAKEAEEAKLAAKKEADEAKALKAKEDEEAKLAAEQEAIAKAHETREKIHNAVEEEKAEKARKKAEKEEAKLAAKKKAEETKALKAKEAEEAKALKESQKASKKEVAHPSSKEKVQTVSVKETLKEKKEEPKVKASKEDKKASKVDKDATVTRQVNAYHVSFRKDLNKWQVKLAGGDKAIKTFNTQLEAIALAKELAHNKAGSIRVHGRDGRIRTI